MNAERSGALSGLKIIEMQGLGPTPFAGMMFSDLGADVVRIDRKGGHWSEQAGKTIDRGRRSIALDLKTPEDVELALALIGKADGLIEGFRPGVMERLGLGPDEALARNPRLIYGRLSGYGQSGPLAQAAGHDINYVALSGALHAMGPADRPPSPPLNLVGDFAGGSLYLVAGMLAAMLHAQRIGQGQVVDCAMSDGAAAVTTLIHGLMAEGLWRDQRQANFLDGAAHFYGCYECADGRFLAVGAVEPQFYAEMLAGFDLADDPDFAAQWDQAAWPLLREKLAARVREKTREEWVAAFAGRDACVSPVLSLAEAPAHPHHSARGVFVEADGALQPGPAPRFSLSPAAIAGPAPQRDGDCAAILRDWGV